MHEQMQEQMQDIQQKKSMNVCIGGVTTACLVISGHGLVPENPFLPVSEGSAQVPLVLQLASLQVRAAKVSPHLQPVWALVD